jgi:hypothetical protein
MGGHPSVGQHLFQTGIVGVEPHEQFAQKRVRIALEKSVRPTD